ncbi:hypothetical protein GCM10025870_28430 [Agromyces marinus]|uniref:Mandelate racemase/muconate lactonizing enzyme C-terminal domain-containing protein n=1 Tax=Agromyces marinus TaxID=1389020 RepID=A0ABM8H4N6_9MICO|nr:hypothetical protein GCM10025870_28430 [Agromyces marinus]
MNITQVKVIVTNPGRNFVTAKIETSEGISGVGDATLNGRELAVATYLSEHVAPMLIGRDAFAIEDTWQLMSRASYWRRGPVQTAAQSAIDMALWDIKGKALGVPVYQLLGGRCRTGVMAYTHAGAAEISETIDDLQMFIEQGYHAVRLQCGVPGVPDVYGVDRDTSTQPGAGTERPYVEGWDTSAYLGVVPKLFEAAREAVGFGTHLLHDVHHRLTPSEAGWLGKRLEDHRLFWLEDALASDYQSAYRLVRQHTTTPLAVGEVFTSLVDCEQLIREQLIDYVRASAVHAGGSRDCARSLPSPSPTRSRRAAMARRTCRRSLWPQRCTSGCRPTTWGSRSGRCIRRKQTTSSRTRTRSPTGTSTRVRPPGSASTSTRPWPNATSIDAGTFRSCVSGTER